MNLPNSINISSTSWLFYISIFFLFFSSTVFVFLLILGVFKRTKKETDKIDDFKDSSYEAALRIMDDARAKSLKILSNSQLEAQEYLDVAEDLTETSRDEMRKRIKDLYESQENMLRSMNEQFMELYKSKIVSGTHENIQSIADTTDLIKNEVLNEVKDLKNTLKNDTIEAQKEIQSRIEEAYSEAEKDIETYKKTKFKEIQNSLLDVVATVITRILEKEIDIDDKEKMVLKMFKEEFNKNVSI